MNEPDRAEIAAQVVLRDARGRSILDAGEAITAANVERYQVEDARVEEAVRRLEALGFAVTARDPATLSIEGPSELFAQVFGTAGPRPAEAAKIPDQLESYVARVIFPAAPEFFP